MDFEEVRNVYDVPKSMTDKKVLGASRTKLIGPLAAVVLGSILSCILLTQTPIGGMVDNLMDSFRDDQTLEERVRELIEDTPE